MTIKELFEKLLEGKKMANPFHYFSNSYVYLDENGNLGYGCGNDGFEYDGTGSPLVLSNLEAAKGWWREFDPKNLSFYDGREHGTIRELQKKEASYSVPGYPMTAKELLEKLVQGKKMTCSVEHICDGYVCLDKKGNIKYYNSKVHGANNATSFSIFNESLLRGLWQEYRKE